MDLISAELISDNGFCRVFDVPSIEMIIPSTTYNGVVLLEIEETPRMLITGVTPTEPEGEEIMTPEARPCNISSTDGPGRFLMASPLTDETAPVRFRADVVP